MDRLTSDIILHLFDFLIIPPKDYISVFLINKYWKEITHDNFLFWERQLSNLFFFVYKNNFIENRKQKRRINLEKNNKNNLIKRETDNIDDFYLFYFHNINNFSNLLKLNFNHFFTKRKRLQNEIIEIIKNKENISELKIKFNKLYNYIFNINIMRLHREKINTNNKIENLQYLEFNLFKFYNLMINHSVGKPYEFGSLSNILFLLDDLIDSYNLQKLNDNQFNVLTKNFFTKLIVPKDERIFVRYRNIFRNTDIPYLVFIINRYLNNVNKYNCILESILQALLILFSNNKGPLIHNYILIHLFENYYYSKETIVNFIYFLKRYANLGEIKFNNLYNDKKYVNERENNLQLINIQNFGNTLKNLFNTFEDKHDGYLFLDFIFHHFKISPYFIKQFLSDLHFPNKEDEIDLIKIFKLIIKNNNLLIKAEDLCFDFICVNDFNLFKKGLEYLFLLIKKENNNNLKISYCKYFKLLLKKVEVQFFIEKDDFILKLNYLKELFSNYDLQLFKLFKRKLFKEFIEIYFSIKNVFPILEFFITEWNFNFTNFVTTKQVDDEYLALSMVDELTKQNIDYYNFYKNPLKLNFPIVLYDLQSTLLNILSCHYSRNNYKKLRIFDETVFNERLKYLIENKLFNFNKQLFISDSEENNYRKNYRYKECFNDGYYKFNIVWIEITTMELIKKIKTVYNIVDH
ncbi:hypothetical protein ABK040_002048 [Willaertia magna]